MTARHCSRLCLVIVAASAAAGGALNVHPFGEASGRVRSATSVVMTNQTAADERQLVAENQLDFNPAQVAEALALHRKAREAQQAANDAQSAVGRVLDELGFKAWEITRLQHLWYGSLEKAKMCKAALPAARERAQAAEAELEAARKDADEKDTVATETKSRKARNEAQEARRRIPGVERRLRDARKHADKLVKDAENARRRAVESWPRLSERWGVVHDAKDSRLVAAISAAVAAQKRARDDQYAAYVALKRVKEGQDEHSDAAEPGQQGDSPEPVTHKPVDSESTAKPAGPDARHEAGGAATPTPDDLDGMGAVELLDAARTVENVITERYVEARSAELALIRAVPKSTAAQSIDAPEPSHVPIDGDALTKPAGTNTDMEAYRSEVRKALEQVETMVARGHELLSSAGGGEIGAASISVEEALASADTARTLEDVAVHGEEGEAKDLTALMNDAYAAEAGGDAGGAVGGGASSAPGSFRYAPFSPDGSKTGRTPAGGWQVRLNPYGEDGAGERQRLRPGIHPGEYADDRTMFAAIPGRRVQTGLSGARWMYVPDWYLIGPFPNPDRRYYDRRYPPESVVDLDAVYEGKDGKAARWEFTKAGQPVCRFTDSYAIYYAYTELWFDEPREMWVALGSDDGSRLYVNGLLVWRTVEAKAWRISEAYRRLSFRKGRNRILYRVENGPAHGWFSFLLHITPPVLKPAPPAGH